MQGESFPSRAQARKFEKIAQRIGKNVGDGSNGAGLDDNEYRPAIEITGEIAVAFVEINIQTAGLGKHARDFGNAQHSEQGHQAGNHPDQEQQQRRFELGGHQTGFLENPRADDRADGESHGGDQTDFPEQFYRFFCFNSIHACPLFPAKL